MNSLYKTKILICDSNPYRNVPRHVHIKQESILSLSSYSLSIKWPPTTATTRSAICLQQQQQQQQQNDKNDKSSLTDFQFNSLDYDQSNLQSYHQHYYNHKINDNDNIDNNNLNDHNDLIRSDSGNSSLNTIDSISNHSNSTSSTTNSKSINNNNNNDYFPCPYYNNDGLNELNDTLLLNVFVPETQSEFDITCSYNQSIWFVKNVLIERLTIVNTNNFNHHQPTKQLLHNDQCLNYGLFSAKLGLFLDEQLTFDDYFCTNNSFKNLNNNNIIDINHLPILLNHNKLNDPDNQLTINDNNFNKNNNRSSILKFKKNNNQVIQLEFLYKQRINFGEIMSTLPLASATRKKRKRSRLIQAIQNGNLDKLAKALVNCDPNFVDDNSGETPLSIASSLQLSNNQLQQQIIVAIVNGGAILDFRTKDGRTALHVAVQKSNFIALKTLLDLGASPNYLDVNGLTPLYYSVIHKSNPKLTQLLLYEHASLGITDQHGWQEIHHASKLGLVQHLEQLLFYGCDMNCRIVGSGNTSLHVAAINDQIECARILLLRGCDTSIVNNSHQNAYQVAVIAGNMSLADHIKNHKPENVIPYRDKPRYNPARRPATQQQQENVTPTNKSKLLDINGASGGRAISPSLSQLTNNTTTTSSGICCDDEDEQLKQKRSVMNNNAQPDNTNNKENDKDDEDDNEDEDDDDDGGENGHNGHIVMPSSESEDSTAFAPDMMVRAISDYNSGDPSHLQLRRNDHVLLLHSDHSPPTIASQKLLLGRRCLDNKEGYFPACCVEKIKPIKDYDSCDRVEGRRDLKMKNMQAATLPTRGRRGARKSYLDKSTTRQYQDRTVILHRGSKGFGFVLRGAKDSSPVLTKQLMQQQQQQQGSVPLIGLQYFDEIEIGGVADAAGLKRGDFLLAVNDVDVRHMSHENVVQLIRQSGDKVTMTIATPVPKQLVSILKKKGQTNQSNKQQSPVIDSKHTNGLMLPPPPPSSQLDTLPSSQSKMQMSQSVYASFNSNRGTKAPPPAPPKRDPSTTLSNSSRARARSLVVASEVRTAHNQALRLLNEVKTSVDDGDKQFNHTKINEIIAIKSSKPQSSPSNSIEDKSRSISRRVSSYEPTEHGSNIQQDIDKTKTENKSKLQKRDSRTMSPPTTPANHSIVDVTLVKGPPAATSSENENARSLSSFQPAKTVKQDKIEPKIPEPDYSSDDDDQGSHKKKDSINDSLSKNKSETPKIKLTTKATVVLKSTSPCPQENESINEQNIENNKKTIDTLKNGMIMSSKNIFEELKEQSAKITSSARLRFANENDGTLSAINGDASQQQQQQISTKAPINVKKNVAEFEKRFNGAPSPMTVSATVAKTDVQQLIDNQQQQSLMSKSCMEKIASQQQHQQSSILMKKDLIAKSQLQKQQQQSPLPCDQHQSTDFRRNSAIITAMAEKVAAVNQLVAEHQLQSVDSGSKSLNSSPIPVTSMKMPHQIVSGSTVVVQKPIAILPGASTAGQAPSSSATLTRRCVTVCEDPIKTIQHQQQQQQLRSQLSSMASSGTLTKLTKPTTHSLSLAEPTATTASILKHSTSLKTSQQPVRTVQYHTGSTGTTTPTGSVDVVPPPPEFAAASTITVSAQQQQPTRSIITQQQQQQPLTINQKLYLQRQLLQQQQQQQHPQSSSSPITIQQTQQQQSSQVHHQQHHHHQNQSHQQQHSQLITGEPMPHPPHYSHQAAHYQLHHNHPSQLQSSTATTTTTAAATNIVGGGGGHHHHSHHNQHHHHHNQQQQQQPQLSSSAPTNADSHTTLMAMRQSLLAAQQQQQQQQQQSQTASNYDYLIHQQQQQHSQPQPQPQQQRVTNPLVSHHHHHQLPPSTNQQQNQLLLQQRALAVANAKLYQQQQQQQQQQLRSGGGQYNTLASSKPQQIQYYIAQQQQPSQQPHHTSLTNPQQQQYFATMGRQQLQQQQPQYLTNQQQMQQQQFATLTRHHQQQILQQQQQHQQPLTAQQQQQNLLNYSQLIQRQQHQQQQLGNHRIMQTSAATAAGNTTLTRQTSISGGAANPQVIPTNKIIYATTAAGNVAGQQPQSQQYQQYNQPIQTQTQAQPHQQQQQSSSSAYTRKSVVEWTIDDVQEWLQRIGMAEHRLKFDTFNGTKMLRLDNNSLINIGVRQQQHRIYILEKLKQQIWQNHQTS